MMKSLKVCLQGEHLPCWGNLLKNDNKKLYQFNVPHAKAKLGLLGLSIFFYLS